ncbi:probable purine permease 11 [Phragmites australis]|uniref:probable purine permease 11 n=1 Tax=Phragmites australis TaxID=29695 RepID=UPI002D776E60|nr:probable purine permease 11 [Phragmites australis]
MTIAVYLVARPFQDFRFAAYKSWLLCLCSMPFLNFKMGEAGEIQLHIAGFRGQEAEDDRGQIAEKGGTGPANAAPPPPIWKRLKWWAVVLANIVFLLAGQSVATLLGRIYYDQGGKSLWMQTVVQSCGAPIAIPLLLYFRPKSSSSAARPLLVEVAAIYAGLGVLLAGDNLMYSYGLLYLPLSTYSIIGATQVCFNAVFSYFLNKEKFRALVLNSVVLLTFSAALIGVGHGSEETSSNVPEGKFSAGFALTLSASALFSLILSLMQLTFEEVLRSDTFYTVLEMQFWSNTIAACVSVAGLFISGEWSTLAGEMEGYQKGKVAYAMTLAWTAITWQLCTMGMMGLVAAVSSLFTNVISTVGTPLSPVIAVIFLGDRVGGVKLLAMLIGVWGLLSYVYQHYLDDRAKVKKIDEKSDEHHQAAKLSAE